MGPGRVSGQALSSVDAVQPRIRAVTVAHVVYDVEGWGVGELVVVDERVAWHELPWPRPPGSGPAGQSGARDPSQTPTHPGNGAILAEKRSRGCRDFAAKVVQLLHRYFGGEPESLLEVPVDLEYETAFYRECARALRGVPRGEVVTYGELAALAGAPGGARAAGSFCARNRLGLFVPCHRVVAADGLGSYGSYGVGYKRRLLELEGAL
jgi:methylated-DNA-[protein]-cysteine S-methyltransferase